MGTTVYVTLGVICIVAGLVVYSCCVAAGRADDQAKEMHMRWLQEHDINEDK